MKEEVLLGMSGGIDSSVAAVLLKEQGYDVIGATMLLCKNENEMMKDIADAKSICDKLNIQHYVFDCRKTFKDKVINNFISCYNNAQTPNPCVECNKYLKFDEFYQKAKELNCKYIATGHYAKIEYSNEYNQYVLKKANAVDKDQSYFLYGISQEMLPYILFPLANYTNKEEIKRIAKNNKIEFAGKKESQEICFIPDNNYSEYIYINSNKKFDNGNIVDINGKILGKHNGIINYTIGQRKGLGVSYAEPLYVIKLNKDLNEVIVGKEEDLYSKEVIINNVEYLISNLNNKNFIEVEAKVRYRAKPAKAKIYKLGSNRLKIIFDEPQRAITPGQSLVFYIGDILAGGGKIM